MLGTVLMFIGIILVLTAVFGFFAEAFCVVGAAIILGIRNFINMLFHAFTQSQISSEYAQYMEDKKAAEQLAEETRELDKQREKEEKHNKMIRDAIAEKIAEFKAAYPNADKSLLDEYVQEFTCGTIARAKEVEKEISRSHLKNTCENAGSNFTAADLAGLKMVSKAANMDMTMNIYKNKMDYILNVNSNGEDIIFTSRNLKLLEYAILSIDTAMDNAHSKNHDVRSLTREQVEQAFAEIVNSKNI